MHRLCGVTVRLVSAVTDRGVMVLIRKTLLCHFAAIQVNFSYRKIVNRFYEVHFIFMKQSGRL